MEARAALEARGGWHGAALLVVRRNLVTRQELVAGGTFLGLAISAMHLAAMCMEAELTYQPVLLMRSVLIAIGASVAALWLAFRLRRAGGG